MPKALLLLFLFATPLAAQDRATAYEALRVLGAQYGRAAVNHVISVTGTDGSPQPKVWRVALEDRRVPAGGREVVIENQRIVSDRPATIPTSTATISTSKLNLDSSGAYQVANHTADTSHVVFTYVSYALRTDARGNPVWVVGLQNNVRQPLGTIYVGANKGNITRVEGMYSGRNIEQVADDRTVEQPIASTEGDDDDADQNIVKRRIKQAFRRTKRDATEMFDNVRRNFADFIDPRR